MIIKRLTYFAALLALFVLVSVSTLYAQAPLPEGLVGYYLAPYETETDVPQVYQWTSDTNTSTQITFAEAGVDVFGLAYDGETLAYASDNQLWLQSIHAQDAESVAPFPVRSMHTAPPPVFSPDGRYLAYLNEDVWLMDLSTRETRQILAQEEYRRFYVPQRFLTNYRGETTMLIVSIGIPELELSTAGVYDLTSDTLQEFIPDHSVSTDLLPLSTGQVLLFGNPSWGDGDEALHLANSLDDLSDYTRVLKFSSIGIGGETLWAEQAVEIEPAVVRIVGEATGSENGRQTFYFDFHVRSKSVYNFSFVDVLSEFNYTIPGQLSPDGQWLAVYQDGAYFHLGYPLGNVKLIETDTQTVVDIDMPERAALFSWPPQP